MKTKFLTQSLRYNIHSLKEEIKSYTRNFEKKIFGNPPSINPDQTINNPTPPKLDIIQKIVKFL